MTTTFSPSAEKDDLGATTQVVEYTYDVFNRRIGKAVDTSSPFDMADAVIERYVLDDVTGVASLDGGNVVLDFVDADGEGSGTMDLERRYLYGNAVDQILAQENVDESPGSADRVYWHLVDNLGTVCDLAKNDGTLREHYEYDSFGNVVSGDTSVTRYLLTSRELDEDTGLQYSRARWYDPAVGRWISEDPIAFGAGDTNLARYVSNSATNDTDPSGLEETSNGRDDELDFRIAARRSGVPDELVDLILKTARETPIGSGRSGLPVGAHQICADWVFTFEQRLDAALNEANGNIATPGIRSRRHLVLAVPLGAQGNTRADVSWRNWILPTLLDWLNSGGPARNGSANGLDFSMDPDYYRNRMLAQIHTVYRLQLADGSVWYVDVGAMQSVLAGDLTIDDLDSGTWHVTPSTSMPNGWSVTDRELQPSWVPRED